MKAEYGKERTSTQQVNNKKPTGALAVPFTEISTLESIALGFRDSLFELVDDNGKVMGQMDSNSFAGGDALIMQWDDKHVLVRGRDLFAAWIKQFDPEGAKKLPGVRYTE